jgi:RNA polymerase sigma-70 factor (ECF subfamily)
MDVLISGEAGVALLIDGAALRSLGLGAAAQPIHRRREEVPYLFGDARDLQVLQNVAEREVAARLESAVARIDCLQLILILLDPTLAEDTRQEAAAEAEELLAQAGTAEAVESILYAHPLPDSADITGALDACANRGPHCARLVSRLVARQSLIARVHQAWQQVPMAMLGTPEDREYVQATFVREGLFRDLVLLIEAAQPINQFLVSALRKHEIQRLAPPKSILESWVEPLEQDRKPQPEEQRVETADIIAEGVTPSYGAGFDRQERLASVETLDEMNRARRAGSGPPEQGRVPILVERIQAGIDYQRSCEELHRMFQRRVHGFFKARGFSGDDCRDLTQETFKTAFSRIGSLLLADRFPRWLFEIADGLYRNELRRRGAAHDAFEESLEELVDKGPRDKPDALAALSSKAPDPLEDALRREQLESLRAELGRLPPQMRRCVYLRLYHDLKYREIAEVMRVSIETVKAYLHQAQKRLAVAFSARPDEEEEQRCL